jgi:radical SAM protein with 4Fe4S-binding SPASM domain
MPFRLPLPQWMRPRRYAASIIFEATSACNLACQYCYNAWKAPIPGDVPAESSVSTFKTLDTLRTKELLARTILGSRARNITWSGGEPSLRPDLIDLMRYVQRMGVSQNLITNGTLLTPEQIEEVVKSGVRVIQVQLVAADRELHNELQGADSYDKATLAIAAARRYGAHTCVVMVLHRRNLPHIHETFRLAFALGAQSIMLNRINPGGLGLQHRDLWLTVSEYEQALDAAEAAAQEFGLWVATSIPTQPCILSYAEKGYKRLATGFCAAGKADAYLALDALGNLRACNHSPEVLGNIFQTSFKRMAKGEAMQRFYAALPEICRGCKQADECQGGCKASAWVAFGSPAVPDPFLQQAVDEGRWKGRFE